MNIEIYDDLVPYSLQQEIYQWIVKSRFTIGWGDTDSIENAQHLYMHSQYSSEHIKKLGILEHLSTTPIQEKIKHASFVKGVVNLSFPTETHFLHTHLHQTVVLYYANIEWNTSWGGETLFYDESATECIRAVNFKPGRLVVFDGKIPHTIRAQSGNAPQYRFTLSIFFENE